MGLPWRRYVPCLPPCISHNSSTGTRLRNRPLSQKGDQEYVLLDEDSNRYYYTVTNNYPVLIQVIGESMQDNEAVTKSLESIQYNY